MVHHSNHSIRIDVTALWRSCKCLTQDHEDTCAQIIVNEAKEWLFDRQLQEQLEMRDRQRCFSHESEAEPMVNHVSIVTGHLKKDHEDPCTQIIVNEAKEWLFHRQLQEQLVPIAPY